MLFFFSSSSFAFIFPCFYFPSKQKLSRKSLDGVSYRLFYPFIMFRCFLSFRVRGTMSPFDISNGGGGYGCMHF